MRWTIFIKIPTIGFMPEASIVLIILYLSPEATTSGIEANSEVSMIKLVK